MVFDRNTDIFRFQSTPLIRGATASLLPSHFPNLHPFFSRTSLFPSSDIHFFSNIPPLHFCVIALRTPLKNHQLSRIIGVLGADMFYLPLITFPEMIEPQTVFFRIDGFFQLMPEFCKLCCVEAAFENGILHSLSVAYANFCYLPKTSFPFCRRRVDIICN